MRRASTVTMKATMQIAEATIKKAETNKVQERRRSDFMN